MKLDKLQKDMVGIVVCDAVFLAAKKFCPIKPIVVGCAIVTGVVAAKGIADVIEDIYTNVKAVNRVKKELDNM